MVHCPAAHAVRVTCYLACCWSVGQLLRVIVAGDAINMVHNGIDINNMYVRNAQRPETAELAMGAFGAAKRGRVNVSKHSVRVTRRTVYGI